MTILRAIHVSMYFRWLGVHINNFPREPLQNFFCQWQYLSMLTAYCFCFLQCGYSSPAESGIIHDLGLSTAEVHSLNSWTMGFITYALCYAIVKSKASLYYVNRQTWIMTNSKYSSKMSRWNHGNAEVMVRKAKFTIRTLSLFGYVC